MADALPHEAIRRAVARALGPAARVERMVPLAGDASSRRYVRVALAGAPIATVVVMLLGEGRFSPAGDELGGPATTELPFVDVERWAVAAGLPVSRVLLDAARDDGLLLVEDVGSASLWSVVAADPASAERSLGAAVDLLVAWQVAGARAPDPRCIAFRRRFDAGLARAELAHFVDHGIETRQGRPLAAAERTRLLDALDPLVAPFVAPAPVLVHRDFMAWNLHVQAGRLRIIDFQDALLGPEAYDLAALLTDRTTPTVLDAAAEARLVDRFRVARAAADLPADPALATRVAECTLHRALKVIGRFWFLERVQGKPGYLAYLPAVYAVARRTFARLPALAEARARIARWVPEVAAEPPA